MVCAWKPKFWTQRNTLSGLVRARTHIKLSLGRRPAAKDRAGLESSLRRYLRRLQRQPERVRAFFRAPTTLYAA